MKNILYVGIDFQEIDSLLKELKLHCLQNNLHHIDTTVTSNLDSIRTQLKILDISCLFFDGINLCKGLSFGSNIIDFIKMLSDNKKFDLKKIVVRFKPFDQNYFRKYEGKLINLGVLEENIFESTASNKKIAEAVVKILNS